MKTHLLTLFLTGMLIAAAPDPKEDEAAKESAKLQGTWQGVTLETEGQQGNASGAILTFEKGNFTFQRFGKVIMKGKFTIDVSKDLRTIDMVVTEADAVQHKDKTLVGIYQIEKDTLKWCLSNPLADPAAKNRPKAFDTKDSAHVLLTFKKGKP